MVWLTQFEFWQHLRRLVSRTALNFVVLCTISNILLGGWDKEYCGILAYSIVSLQFGFFVSLLKVLLLLFCILRLIIMYIIHCCYYNYHLIGACHMEVGMHFSSLFNTILWDEAWSSFNGQGTKALYILLNYRTSCCYLPLPEHHRTRSRTHRDS